MARTYDFEIMASASPSQGKTHSAILFSCISDLRGDRIICLPFSDYCDPLVEDTKSWNELIEPILACGMSVTLRCLHNELPVNDRRFTTARKAMWHAVDFARSEGELWVGLSGSARQNVRKAKRNGAVVRERRSIEAVRTFYSVHLQLRKSKYRLLAQPVAFFENLHQLFASHTDLRSEQIGHMLKRITHLLTEPTVPDEVTASAGDELHRFFC